MSATGTWSARLDFRNVECIRVAGRITRLAGSDGMEFPFSRMRE